MLINVSRREKLMDANWVLSLLEQDEQDNKTLFREEHPMSWWKYAISHHLIGFKKIVKGNEKSYDESYCRSMFDIMYKEYDSISSCLITSTTSIASLISLSDKDIKVSSSYPIAFHI